ncbi:MAG TPA: ABC transporter ATP-binding protein [Roseateles sp.]
MNTVTASAPIDIAQLSLGFDGKPVLQGLDWRVAPGQVVGLLGRNGTGKTTLLETALGLREADAGEVRLFGCPAVALDDAARARVGYVPQQSNLFEWMTPEQLLRYFRAFYPRWNEAKVEGLLSRWDIDRRQAIAKLSAGQQQRLSIIRALAHEPELLVLDEPVASLDPAGRRDFLQELVEQVSNLGTTIVFSTHILSDLERVAVDVALLEGGRLALQAPLGDLLDDARRVRGPSSTLQAWLQATGLPVLATRLLEGGRLQVVARVPEGAVLPAGLESEALGLEDLFLAVTAA